MHPLGYNEVLGKFAFEYGIRPETLIALRILVSSCTLLVPLLVDKRQFLRIKKKDVVWFCALGIFATALQRIAFFYALDFTTVTIATMLFFTYPIFVTLFSSLFLRERITASIVSAMLLSFAGIALMVKIYEVSFFSSNIWGMGAGLLSSILFVFYFFTTKKLRNAYTNWTLILYGDGIGALFLSPLIVFSLSNIMHYPSELWLIVLAIAWFPSLLAYLLYSYALKYVESTRGSILAVIEPLSASLFSVIILGENLTIWQMAGIALTLTGIVLLFYRFRK